MNDFIRCNKLTGVYWLQGPVDKLNIRIRLKPPEDIISLPKFEEYTNDTGNVSLEQNIEEFSFNWQERCFSEQEVLRYKDVHNCLTENELRYHEVIKTKEVLPQKVFTYVHEDCYMPVPQEKKRGVGLLSSLLERLNLSHAVGRIGDVLGKSDSERQLFRSQETVCGEEQWTAMHVMFDNLDNNEESLLLPSREAVLVSMFHNRHQNYLLVSPDCSQLDSNPYSVETRSGDLLGYQYGLELDLGQDAPSQDLNTLLTQLHGRWERQVARGAGGAGRAGGAGGAGYAGGAGGTGRAGGAHYYLTLELAAAGGFLDDTLYIDYHIQLPEGLHCSAALRGRSALTAPAAGVCCLGHTVHLQLEGEAPGHDPAVVWVYMEVISVDGRGVRRARGAARGGARLAAGRGARRLRCLCAAEPGGAQRAFFLGGCHLVPEEARATSHMQNGDYTFTETGWVELRSSVVVQRAGAGEGAGDGGAGAAGAGGAGELLRGAEAALRRYRAARARLRRAAAHSTHEH